DRVLCRARHPTGGEDAAAGLGAPADQRRASRARGDTAQRLLQRVTPTSVEVFAVEPTAAQLIVRSADDGAHELAVGDRSWAADVRDGVTAVELDDLEPYAMYPLVLDGQPAGQFRTLPPPPGRYLGRFATVSDVHIGETAFG